MADTYTLTLTGDEVKALLDMLINSGVTQTQLGYLNGLTSNIQTQISTQGQLISNHTQSINANTQSINTHTQPASRVSAGTFGGKVVGNTTAEAVLTDGQFRNIFISTSEPTSGDGNDGDIWIVYET